MVTENAGSELADPAHAGTEQIQPVLDSCANSCHS